MQKMSTDNINNNGVASNAAWIVGCKLIKAVLTLVVTMIVARQIGPEKYGVINFAASLVAFFAPVMNLGLNSVLVHEVIIKPEKEGETIGTATGMNVLSSLLCIVGVIAATIILDSNNTQKIIVCAIYSLMLLFQAFELIRFWFHAKLLAKYTAIAMLISYIVVAIAQIVVVLINKNIFLIAFILVADYLIIAVILMLIYNRIADQKMSFSWDRAKELFKESKHFILPGLMVIIFAKTDIIMISSFLGDSAAGYYSAAVTCATMTSFVFVAIIDSFRPVIFKKLDNNDEVGFEKSLTTLYSIITYLSFLQSVVMTVFSTIVVKIMYGAEYSPAITALQIVVWFTTFSYYGTIRNIWMIAKGQQKHLFIINMLGAAANVGLNFVFIPLMGINGAALASLITQFFTNVIVGFILKPIRKNNLLILKSLNISNIIALFSIIKKKKEK